VFDDRYTTDRRRPGIPCAILPLLALLCLGGCGGPELSPRHTAQLTAAEVGIQAGKQPVNLVSNQQHIIDVHVHVAGLGYGDSGCFINEGMRKNFRFPFYLLAMDVSEDELRLHGDRVLIEKLSRKVADSRSVTQAVILAMDGYVTEDGRLDKSETQIYVPDDYVARETARYDNLLFGASINPHRKDAINRLRKARHEGAVLVKWIPSIMNIDPSDERFVPFYQVMVELDIPLLTHTGMEKSFANSRDELADPLKLRLPLEIGVTVIAAHIATTGESEGQDNFERILPMFQTYENLYTDISSLTQANKLGYLAKALKVEGLSERMIFGTDWPLQFVPLVLPWYHVNHIGTQAALSVSVIDNKWDKDVALKRTLGVPDAVFERTARVLKINPAPAGGG
jgi:predicted TIM-barrel fold metal-dependent hydrolase